MFIRKIFIGLMMIPAAVAPVAAQPAGNGDRSRFWRTAQNCGANCLFLMLRSRGHDLEYERVLDATPIGLRGSTLADLAVAANRLGFDARVGRGAPDDLKAAELPVMIHLDSPTGDVRAAGHYVLLTHYDAANDIAEIFDGSSALRTHISMNRLKRTWSGFVLELKSSPAWAWRILVSATALLVAVWIYQRRGAARGVVTET